MNIAEKLRISLNKPGKGTDSHELRSDTPAGSAKQVEAQVTDRVTASIKKARRLSETLDRAIVRGA